MKEFQELVDFLPYCFMVLLPVFLALSPCAPPMAAATTDFPAHRAAHFESSGSTFGPKTAALNLEARARPAGRPQQPHGGGAGASGVLRKVVVERMQDLTVGGLTELLTSGVAGLVLLVPARNATLSEEQRENVISLEDHLLTTELQIPIYLTEEGQDTNDLLAELKESAGTSAKVSGAQGKSQQST